MISSMYPRKATPACLERQAAIKNILIVDDNVLMSRFLKLKLQSAGYKVKVIDNIEQAGLSDDKSNPEIIVLSAPGLPSVREAVERLRTAFKCPVIVYGVNYNSAEERKAAGADYWIESAGEPDEFVRFIEKIRANKDV